MVSLRTSEGRIAGMILQAAVVAIAMTLTTPAHAQSFTVLHSFTGAGDGANPYAGLTQDRAGNFYGTTSSFGSSGGGTVFKLAHSGSSWILSPLFAFPYGAEGFAPQARVVFGPDGSLYGTTSRGIAGGIVFNLRVPPTVCKSTLCPWSETVLHNFQGDQDGSEPGYGDVIFDRAGNLYGVTIQGGGGLCNDSTCGTVYQLTPSHGGWTESILYRFADGGQGYWPYNGVVQDSAGNLYGATTWNFSSVYQLTPNGSGWSETTLHTFTDQSNGTAAQGGLIFDPAGNLYGTTSFGGPGGGGTVFKLAPAGGSWTLTTIYAFPSNGPEPTGPTSTLAMDAAGNLYGTTFTLGLHGAGSVFKLSPSGGSWTFTSLHDFTGGADGGQPYGQVILDSNGNVFGTTTIGGNVGSCYQGLGCGVIFEITP